MGNNFKLIPNYIYFYHLNEYCILPLYPDSITDSQGARFSSHESLGRTAPVQTYSGTGARTVSFSFDLHRDLMNEYNRDISNMKREVVDFTEDDYIDTLVKHLQAVSFPRYRQYSNTTKGIEPPMVAVRIGEQMFIKGIISSDIQVTYGAPIMEDGKYAKISLSLTITEIDPYDADTVLQLGSFRALTASNYNSLYAG